MINIDLHTHSNCSDGTLPPAQLVARAAAAGVEVLALTDHDTIGGIEAAQAGAHEQGLTLVPGVEISASWRSQTLHVLGLWIDPTAHGLSGMLDGQAVRRRSRLQRMCARLTALGLPGDDLERAVEARPGIPTRAHLADALVAGGHVTRAELAFRRYLGKGRPAHCALEWPGLDEVVRAILGAGGIASLAHLTRYKLSAGARRQLLADFKAVGGGALEVFAGANGAQYVEGCAALAVRFGLMGSVGSDFHDPDLAWNPLGRSLKLPDCVVPVWRGRGL